MSGKHFPFRYLLFVRSNRLKLHECTRCENTTFTLKECVNNVLLCQNPTSASRCLGIYDMTPAALTPRSSCVLARKLSALLALLKVTDIFLYIKGYLNPKGLRSLCNCSAKLRDEKFRYLSWPLTRFSSLEFYWSNADDDNSFKSRILRLMFDSRVQLTLYLDHVAEIKDVSALNDVYSLCLSYCMEVTDVSALGHVHTLNLRNCKGVTDVSALGHVHTLNLSCCSKVTDVSALGHVHTLDLSGCSGVTDVSALGHVHTLKLSGC